MLTATQKFGLGGLNFFRPASWAFGGGGIGGVRFAKMPPSGGFYQWNSHLADASDFLSGASGGSNAAS